MKVKTKLTCPICGKKSEVTEFYKDPDSLYQLIAQCSCGASFQCYALKMSLDDKKKEITFESPQIATKIHWSKQKNEEQINPSER
jgi:transcription elongation factor Elf1